MSASKSASDNLFYVGERLESERNFRCSKEQVFILTTGNRMEDDWNACLKKKDFADVLINTAANSDTHGTGR
jgi:hypothetical protein